MASIQTRNSVLAIVKETTEGVLKKPTLATDYVALQDDFTLDPGFQTLDNAEIKASIGAAKSIIGAEAPTASMSHYFRASGVEGQAPNYGLFLEACLGGTSTASTEYDTIAGSTISALKVNTGEGAFWQRGQAALIKDATNGYRIRAIDSISGDDLSLSFQTPVGTPSGVNLGKCILYKPENNGHPTFSMWQYLGQQGAIQAVAGARVTAATFDMSAGELINANYSMEGVAFYFDPIEVVAGSNVVNFDIGAGNVAATVPAAIYKTPHDLAAAVLASISGAAAGAYTFAYSDTTGKFTLTKSAGTLDVDWLSGANSIGATLGFTADDTGALSYTSDVAQDYTSPQNPSFDAADPLVAKDNEVMVGVASEYACFKASSCSMAITTPKADILSICSASGKLGSIIASRQVTTSITALLEQYDAGEFESFRVGKEIKFQYSAGVKAGGNWVPGKCAMLYQPTATITAFSISDQDGIAQLNIDVTSFVNQDGEGEVYVAFV